MNAEIFAEWLRRQGYRVIRTESSYWYNQGPRVYQAFPYHWSIRPTEQELHNLLAREHAVGLRYSTPLDAAYGIVSYHTIFDSASYDLETLSANARSKVRRGLKRCRIEPISMDCLAQDGWALQYDTMKRQDRVGSVTQSGWQKLCLAAKDLRGFEAWGGFVNEELAASLLVARIDDTCYMLYPQSHSRYFSTYVNNALSYSLSNEMLSRSGIRKIFYGLNSLDAPASVDEFKFSMGYTAEPVRQRVVFHPWLAPAFNRTSYALVKRLAHWWPGNPTLAKTEGMLRFYLEGKRPLAQQPWPAALLDVQVAHAGDAAVS